MPEGAALISIDVASLENATSGITDFSSTMGPGDELNSTVSKRYRDEAMGQCGTFTPHQIFQDGPRPQVSGYSMSANLAAARNLFHTVIANAVCHDTPNSNCSDHHTTQGLITVEPLLLAGVVEGIIESHLSIYF